MKFAIAFANTGPFINPDKAVAMAQAAEAAGFESLWTVEHVVVPADYQSPYPYSDTGKMPGGDDSPIPDPLIWLTYIAAATTSINLATGILILPQRNPVVLAKELATLDFMSNGRMLLGTGVGWMKEEFDAIGVPFNERGKRNDENIAAMRALWSEEKASYHGEFVNFDNCILRPQPVKGSIPIHIGGSTDIAAKRAGRLGDGFFPAGGSHEEIARIIGITRESAIKHGRNPDDVEITTGGNGAIGPNALEEISALEALGVDRVIVPAFLFYRGTEDTLAQYGEEVISKVN
jgi:probable F420-dependent oxidoreductase